MSSVLGPDNLEDARLWWCWEFFTPEEFRCNGSGLVKVDPGFMDKLSFMRETLGFAFPVTSGYRSPEYNSIVSSSGNNGPHTTGKAVDIALSGEQALRVIEARKSFGFTGVGLKQHGPHKKRFVHLDDLDHNEGIPRPWIWTYG